MNPKHIGKITDQNRVAIAPYNFVELPEKVVEAEELPSGDRYHSDKHTGKIECTLTTESPLYIRCGMTPEDFAKYSDFVKKESPKNMAKEEKRQWEKKEQERKEKWEKERKEILAPFFTYSSDGLPVLPGSSLRGMLRILVEIISFSKIDHVSEHQKFFFRAVAADKDDPLKHKYKLHNVQAGYLELKKSTQQWFIRPAFPINKKEKLSYVPVKESDIDPNRLPSLVLMKKDNYLPQYIKVSFRIDGRSVLVSENLRDYPESKGWLITSGNMLETSNLTESEREAKLNSKEGRKYHYIVHTKTLGDSIEISPDAISDYKAALTNFQNGKLFKDHSKNPFREDRGVLEDGRPIFYCQPKPGQPVKLFGQSPNFRTPYIPNGKTRAASAVDFIPENLKDITIIDLADAIFGFVRREKQPEGVEQSCAGRVFISDAKYKSDENGIWYKGNQEDTVTPQILASPKPTTFQHYLVQPKETNAKKKNLKHYASKPVEETVIRGHKLYWHKGSDPNFEHQNSDDVSDTQTTKIKPLKKGVTFKFAIHFENLSDVELGALMWILDIAQDDKYRLKLGMGKPLGMGAVKVESKLYLSDRKQRYKKLFQENNWHIAEIADAADTHDRCVKAFEKYVLNHISEADQPNTGKATTLEELPRIKMLLAMLSWSDVSSNEARYMEIERDQEPRIGTDGNEYKERPVLPTPLQVIGWEDNRKINNPNPSPQPRAKISKPVLKKSKPPTRRNKEGGREDKGGGNPAFVRPPKPPKRR